MKNITETPQLISGISHGGILVSGGGGFVGSALLRCLSSNGWRGRAIFRRDRPRSLLNFESVSGFDLLDPDKSVEALEHIDCVVHCAARVPDISDKATGLLEEFRSVNVEGTLKFARLAAQAGIRRFVFLSSIKVYGESSNGCAVFTEKVKACPSGPYGQSKLEAEDGLRKLADQTGMEVTIVRCPLIYGPGVKGNFNALMNLADSPWPLPLGGIDNARSLLFVGNLTDFLMKVVDAPAAANETFLVSDGYDLSTSELVSKIRRELGRPPRLWPFPWVLLRVLARLTGKDVAFSKLLDSLQVDSSKARRVLGWKPPYSVNEGLAATILADRNRQPPPRKV